MSNLSSSTEPEIDIKLEEGKTVRRPKRLIKTTEILDILHYVMNTGKTVEKLDSGIMLSRTDAEPEMETHNPI